MKNDSDNSLKKVLENISSELKGIRAVLGAIWHSRYKNDETDLVSPEVYAEEYISTEECARRLNVSDQTIRNWILQGKKKVKGGWIQGVHYIVIPRGNTKHLIRIPWNNLILTFYKGPEATLRSFDPPKGNNLYTTNTEYKYEPQPNLNTVIPKDVNK